jgi:hypothetical protein
MLQPPIMASEIHSQNGILNGIGTSTTANFAKLR